MKRGLLILGIFLVLIIVSLGFFVYADQANSYVSFEVDAEPQVFILSPENTTYGFYFGKEPIIDLDVSANFETDTWWYNLYDLENDEIVNDSVVFEPGNNQTIEAVKGVNKLQVFANDSIGNSFHSNVTFTVQTESSPILGPIDDPIYACENESLNYEFNATDIDSDELEFDISPRTPFYIDPAYRTVDVEDNVSYSYVISTRFDKEEVRNYTRTIVVTDPTDLSDSTETTIEVIPINNHPDVEEIGVRTVYTKGDNSTFYEVVNVSDVEDGNQESENISFELDFHDNTPFFDISSDGVINYSGKTEDVGSYVIGLCVNDTGIEENHSMIDVCQGDFSPARVCQNFSLTVTNENRPPEIIEHYPNHTEDIVVKEGESVYFNITKYDPDGNIPESYWFLNNSFMKHEGFENEVDEFEYGFGSESAGNYSVLVNVSDGLENTSLRWNISVLESEISSGGGGSIGGMPSETCKPKWVCDFWTTCQLVDIGVVFRNITKNESTELKHECVLEGINESLCGFKTRKCYDINECDNETGKPRPLEVCEFEDDPGCDDGKRNCHSGSCEIGVDCGGPCPPCPTCSDGIKNQDEEGVDCGGPCPPCRPTPESLFQRINIVYVLIITFALLFAAVIIRIIKLIRDMEEEETNK